MPTAFYFDSCPMKGKLKPEDIRHWSKTIETQEFFYIIPGPESSSEKKYCRCQLAIVLDNLAYLFYLSSKTLEKKVACIGQLMQGANPEQIKKLKKYLGAIKTEEDDV
jgi:hypothetical protein